MPPTDATAAAGPVAPSPARATSTHQRAVYAQVPSDVCLQATSTTWPIQPLGHSKHLTKASTWHPPPSLRHHSAIASPSRTLGDIAISEGDRAI
eukprot:CAMPEP_0115860624 /NCGR_PEP_ID=MMETSP0287-20121206/17224_1 /TAXON_ID=412157 /ORGANISM="Chrysochromulina rotalis, Strain UIO044" /LENGTH=93 /DNA_ID=CAMNT_0003314955 /DNA_START=485 /DNA_END=767 /DNA_ORIENTATION=+